MITVLFITHEYEEAFGSTKSLLNMIHAVRSSVRPVVLFPRDGALVEKFKRLGIETIVMPFHTTIVPSKGVKSLLYRLPKIFREKFTNRKTITRLMPILADRHIDLIHTNTGAIELGFYLAQKMGVPHVWHIREFMDLDFSCVPLQGFKHLRNLAKKSETISITKAVMTHHGFMDFPRAHQIYNAIGRSEDLVEAPKFPKSPYFMLCGRLAEGKGVETAIAAFSRFHAKHSDYKLLLIGHIDADYKAKMWTLIESSAKENIEFVDYTENLAQYYQNASALLMCSENEALGRVTIEAMFNGCPVVGRRSGGTAEIIEDKHTGLLFSSVEDCAACMEKVTDSRLAESLADNALKMASENFTETVFAAQLMHVYQKTLNDYRI